MMATAADRDDLFDIDAEEAAVTRAPLSLRAKLGIAAGLAVLTAIASVYGWQFATVPVRWQEVGFTVTSATEIQMVFDVFVYTDEPVACDLQALNPGYLEVGVGRIEIDPDAGTEQRIRYTIPTVEEATTAVVADCRPMP